MGISETALENYPQDTNDEQVWWRRRTGAIAGITVALAGTAVLATGATLPTVIAGMNLGNHNETLLTPDRRGSDS